MTPNCGDRAREMVRGYSARTGLSFGQIGRLIGVACQTMHQFVANCYPHDEDPLSKRLIAWLEANPAEVEDVAGKLYVTENVRLLDRQLSAADEGELSLIYGGPGTQKTFVLKRRVAERLRAGEFEAPATGYIYCSVSMGRKAIAQEICRAFAVHADGASAYASITNAVQALRRRKKRGVLVLDEAHHLGAEIRLLELVRELHDRTGCGLIVTGHDNLEQIFDPDRSPLEQFVQRFDYRLRLPGLSEGEVREISQAELGPLGEKVLRQILEQSRAHDRHMRREYYSARYLFKVVGQVRRARGGNGKFH
jgi:DNA transposition AAA+ family ATPase